MSAFLATPFYPIFLRISSVFPLSVSSSLLLVKDAAFYRT